MLKVIKVCLVALMMAPEQKPLTSPPKKINAEDYLEKPWQVVEIRDGMKAALT